MINPQGGLQRILSLDEEAARDPGIAGPKAATESRLRASGFPVPDGFVIPASVSLHSPTSHHAIGRALEALGGSVAVRSSALAEDRSDASFAGQYETILGVEGLEAVLDAVGRVRKSGEAERVARYREGLRADSPTGVAVLVQRMVPADVAGVAFTADPITGDRATTLVSGVRGLGDRLISGELVPDEWAVRDRQATARRTTVGAVDAPLALAIAKLARRLEAHEGVPLDVEWAAAGGQLFVLQARPMTALPDEMSWQPGAPGLWMRNFRLGEWLAGPVTPLFESWLLTRIEGRFQENVYRLVGLTVPQPLHVIVNGWYFYGFNLPSTPRAMLAALVRHVLPRLLRNPRHVAMAIPPISAIGIDLAEKDWRTRTGPRYRSLVAAASEEVERADGERLVTLVDELATEAGDFFNSLAMVAGFASKTERPLATFYVRYLAPEIGGSQLDLLAGLGDEAPSPASHAVWTLDWVEPTLGEASVAFDASASAGRHLAARERRLAAEARARQALAPTPKLARRFERLVGRAQRFGRVREEQVAGFTLAWPVLRRAALRLGAMLVFRGSLDATEQVFWLTRRELLGALRWAVPSLEATAAERRATWERQARLAPPLMIGEIPPMLARFLREAELSIRGANSSVGADIIGIPASPGRATGPARVVRSLDGAARVKSGDVLVCPLTAPAWTSLFGRIAAIVTDNGGVSAHASIVAREYGIPAVVGTRDATVRLRDGMFVEVDGSAGTVRRAAARR
jgi:rifampicin phosphotransferase